MTEQYIGLIRETLGYAPDPGEIIPGRMIRFATSDRKGDDAGWCKFFEDREGGVFGCWRQGLAETWLACSNRTPEVQEKFLSRVKQTKEEAAVIEEDIRRECREKSAELWENGREVDEAKLFLTSLLADGPVSSKQIRVDAEGAGLSWWPSRERKRPLASMPTREG